MTMRHRRTRRRGLTQYKVLELLVGRVSYPNLGYNGYGDPHGERVQRTVRDSDGLMGYERAICPRYSPSGTYTCMEPFIGDEMRADWQRYRDALLRFWISGEYSTSERLQAAGVDVRMSPGIFFRGWAGTRPWAWWTFDAPGPLPEGEDELAFLERHELLFEGERAMRADQEQWQG